ncbi:Dynein heavy chain cytoplasmic, partial [Coniosporium uncinatum]
MDESNVLDSGFLERMNTLLANAEVPGLFEGDEFATLMTACREGAQRQGVMLDSQEELYKWFTQQIVKNLHVVFTMNPPEEGLSSKAATSPALFNRCVLNWFGDWSDQALYQVGLELTQSVDLDRANYSAPDSLPVAYRGLSLPPTHRDAMINAMVYVHHSVGRLNARLQKQQSKVTYLTPRHFLDFVSQYNRLYHEKREDLEEQQRHLNVGLDKLRETFDKVRDLRKSLSEKKTQLERKDKEANEKLQQMLSDQKEAEDQKTASLEAQAYLAKQEKIIQQQREQVNQQLADAEPALEAAKEGVKNIKKQQLNEARSLQNPPVGVKLALESVCVFLGHKVTDWKSVQSVVKADDFRRQIENYDNDRRLPKPLRAKISNDYLSNPSYTRESVDRASKACGPLVDWVRAQVLYAETLDMIGPLRAQVDALSEEALTTKANAMAMQNKIKELEDNIATYKT